MAEKIFWNEYKEMKKILAYFTYISIEKPLSEVK